jgi:hypothetical protein
MIFSAMVSGLSFEGPGQPRASRKPGAVSLSLRAGAFASVPSVK